jgi:signal transduction histidine kinase
LADKRRRFFSLERKLPILISGLVAAALIVVLGVVRYELHRSATESAAERLDRVAHQLAELSATGLANRIRTLESVAQSAAVIDYALAQIDDMDAVVEQLQRLQTGPGDSALALQLRALDGRVVDARPLMARVAAAAESDVPPDIALTDSTTFSDFTSAGDSISYWVSAPVRAQDRIIGHVVQQRRVRPTTTADVIEGLLGSGIDFFFASRNGEQLVDIEDATMRRGPRIESLNVPTRVQSDSGVALAYALPIERTPWLLVAQMPMDGILARPNGVLRNLVGVGFVLLILGGIGAWLVSRSVTRPLGQLRVAADALARGDYSRRTGLRRDDEIGRVARSFDAMADRIDESHAQLAQQFKEARALTLELENTNALLNTAVRDADAARLDAQNANRAKSEFLATMSHEIRTPINAVVGYTDLMQIELPGPLTDQQRDYVERIRQSAEHLTSLVNDVLDFAKVESGQMRIARDRLSARTTVANSIAMLQSTAAVRRINLTCDCPGDQPFLGDTQRVQQILLNLLSNAIKFSDPGGSVRVLCSTRESRQAPASPVQYWTCIDVADDGTGISPDQLERIFEPFIQGASGYTRTHGGTGLGLAISRSLARMMGGDITVESEPGHGSVFTLWLPREPA